MSELTPMQVADLARALGLARALATCPENARMEGVREGGAEIAAILARAVPGLEQA